MLLGVEKIFVEDIKNLEYSCCCCCRRRRRRRHLVLTRIFIEHFCVCVSVGPLPDRGFAPCDDIGCVSGITFHCADGEAS